MKLSKDEKKIIQHPEFRKWMSDTIQTIKVTTLAQTRSMPPQTIYLSNQKTIHLIQIDTYKAQLSQLIKEAQMPAVTHSLRFQQKIQSFRDVIEISVRSIIQSSYHHHESKLQILFYILYVIEVYLEVYAVKKHITNIKLPNNRDPLRWTGLVYPEFKIPRIRH